MKKIKNSKELSFAIKADLMMNRGKFQRTISDRIKNLIWPDYIMCFLVLMRKVQYYSSHNNFLSKLFKRFYLYRYNKIQMKLGFSISPLSMGYGLVIPHYGTIVVGRGEIGNYAVLHTSTCITTGKNIGDGLYLGTGAKIINPCLSLGSNVMCGSNCVVNRNFKEENILLAGIPAEKKRNISSAWYDLHGQPWITRHEKVEELRIKMFSIEN